MDNTEQILRNKALRVPLERLVGFDCVWAYADGIWSGVVWVKPPDGGVDKAKPCWYRCVGENTHGFALNTHGFYDGWYRKFLLYDMTMEQFEKARRYSELKAITNHGHAPYIDWKKGIRKPLTESETNTINKLVTLLGPETVSDLWQEVHEIKAGKLLRSDTVIGWFQR
jgi:hypothetical protein